jgi:hypothetical protein
VDDSGRVGQYLCLRPRSTIRLRVTVRDTEPIKQRLELKAIDLATLNALMEVTAQLVSV